VGDTPKSYEKIDYVHEHWIDPDSRELWIHGVDISGSSYEGIEPGVEYIMATKVIKNLHFFRKQSTKDPVLIHLHTCGGVWEEGMAIYDTIRSMPYPVTMISYTHARSMSSIILQAADKRVLMPSSYFMFHYGTLGTDGDAKSVYSQVDFTKQQDEVMIDIYVDCVRNSEKFKDQSETKIRKTLVDIMNKKGDVFLKAEEAIEWGFADEILQEWPSYLKWKKR
jgi:ATP-dependent Clp protease protease subunit